MLVLFWLPILLSMHILISIRCVTDLFPSVSLLWALHHSVRFVLHTLKTTLSLKTGLRA